MPSLILPWSYLSWLPNLYRDLGLLLRSPRDYLFSFTYPDDQYIKIYPYNPRITQKGRNLVKSISQKLPHLKICFHGSAALGIAGQRDIDIVVNCQPSDFDLYLPALILLFGLPTKRRPNFIEWQFRRNNCDIDITLIDSFHPRSIETIRVYEILKKDKQLLQTYEQLKLSSNGTSVREYKRRRMQFFNQILRS